MALIDGDVQTCALTKRRSVIESNSLEEHAASAPLPLIESAFWPVEFRWSFIPFPERHLPVSVEIVLSLHLHGHCDNEITIIRAQREQRRPPHIDLFTFLSPAISYSVLPCCLLPLSCPPILFFPIYIYI